MIFSIRNCYLRGLAVWGLVLLGVLIFPFVALIGGAADVFYQTKDAWRDACPERRAAWRLMTFRSVDP